MKPLTSPVELTMLNGMADSNFSTALQRHSEWGLRWLDLKDSIFGKSLNQLTDDELAKAANEVRAMNLSVYCLSTNICHQDVEAGEKTFREQQASQLSRIISAANHFHPVFVRLLSASTSKRSGMTNSHHYLGEKHPWLFDVYRELIDTLSAQKVRVTIENECGANIWSTPTEILGFFEQLDRPKQVSFTWDVQNLWQVGTYPTLEVYHQLKPLISYYHLKGGREDAARKLAWASPLSEASWPVAEITREVIADGVSPVICLNPSHGPTTPDANRSAWLQQDLDFVRNLSLATSRA